MAGARREGQDRLVQERAAILDAIFDHTNLLIACLDPDLRFVRVNEAYAAMEKRPPSFFVGKGHFDLYPSEENEKIFRDVVRTGEPHTARARPFEYARSRDRGTTYWDWSLVPVENEGKVTGLVLSLLDVTARIRAIEELAEREQLFRALYEQSPDAITLVDPRERAAFRANGGVARLLGAASEEIDAERSAGLAPIPELSALVDRVVELGDGRHETRIRTVSGEVRDVAVSTRVVDVGGTPMLQSVLEDVTEVNRARERIQRSLDEKLVLLREVHHRVKNNLQLISSLLYLQRTRIEDPAARRAFEESTNRILSMAMIHERLYRSGDFVAVSLDEYLGDLARHLAASVAAHERGIEIAIDVVPLRVPIDIAVPCGLALNELISNALDHAFPERGGTVRVAGERSPEGRVILSVEDDGIGLPDVMHPDLGLRMVESLASQLEGRLTFERGRGTRVVLDIPLPALEREA